MSHSLEMLPPWARARRYRELSAEVTQLADAARFPEIRASYVSLAASWDALADDLEGKREQADDAALHAANGVLAAI